MERSWTTDLPERHGERVLLKGWLHHFRRLSRVSFLLLRDARGISQIVLDDPELVRPLEQLHRESVLEVEGTVVGEPQAPGGCEVREPAVRVLTEALEAPPVELHTPA